MLFAAVLVHPVSVRTKRELSSDREDAHLNCGISLFNTCATITVSTCADTGTVHGPNETRTALKKKRRKNLLSTGLSVTVEGRRGCVAVDRLAHLKA